MSLEVILALAAVAAWLLLTWFTLLRPSARQARAASTAGTPSVPAGASTAVVYASQTGTAIELAQRTAQALGDRAVLLPIDRVAPEQLLAYEQVLFIASTYGEGDAPDMAHAFHERMLADDAARATDSAGSSGRADPVDRARVDEAPFAGLRAGILALGDSSYSQFCGFGMALESWLKRRGATLLFDTIRVDRADPRALDAWSEQLSLLFQARLDTGMHFDGWTLIERSTSNPSGAGRPCHELRWRPAGDTPLEWKAGDIAHIEIGDSGERREYSIASIPSEGMLRLLVREHQRPDGTPGLGSHWLGSELAPGAPARLHIRANPLFRAPDDDRPAIFVGNGTGIAGLRALLQERLERGHHDNWLVFGERTRVGDFHWGDTFETWLRQGKLQRMDLAFSRDQAEKRYVHHLLRESAADLREWAGRGALLYVCGSKDGMAQDVDQALRDILGLHGYEALLQRQGYRRDVY
ncbi:sulfite reductase subunit alpha [Pusillimonas noertemannii]|uniref:NADPH--hemoprotein reductase n=1 Tax=Pusillimonas noertemannii TaxID=305977 RepID=A0A2U1CNQ5_9BURK|nr:sulfite reductase subunit alpha [Pusillimonas noertemannii]NYT68342.1 flavodoxin domain-containing protein [Pusillimonas noertemannii]PVY62643.1 sulfite reductase (NADPH) flavoprotein alpha-component [Pusillimonas noertemannii]